MYKFQAVPLHKSVGKQREGHKSEQQAQEEKKSAHWEAASNPGLTAGFLERRCIKKKKERARESFTV